MVLLTSSDPLLHVDHLPNEDVEAELCHYEKADEGLQTSS